MSSQRRGSLAPLKVSKEWKRNGEMLEFGD